jgi:hypothetical protein
MKWVNDYLRMCIHSMKWDNHYLDECTSINMYSTK